MIHFAVSIVEQFSFPLSFCLHSPDQGRKLSFQFYFYRGCPFFREDLIVDHGSALVGVAGKKKRPLFHFRAYQGPAQFNNLPVLEALLSGDGRSDSAYDPVDG